MASSVQKIPQGQGGVTPYLCVGDAARAIEFYKKTLGATELMRMPGPNGRIGHAELQIGTGRIMLADEFPDHGFRSPLTLGGSPVTLSLYVEDVDRVAKAFKDAGAKELRPLEHQFYGDRAGQFQDPFGHVWWLATHVEDVSPEEMQKRAAKLAT